MINFDTNLFLFFPPARTFLHYLVNWFSDFISFESIQTQERSPGETSFERFNLKLFSSVVLENAIWRLSRHAPEPFYILIISNRVLGPFDTSFLCDTYYRLKIYTL